MKRTNEAQRGNIQSKKQLKLVEEKKHNANTNHSQTESNEKWNNQIDKYIATGVNWWNMEWQFIIRGKCPVNMSEYTSKFLSKTGEAPFFLEVEYNKW